MMSPFNELPFEVYDDPMRFLVRLSAGGWCMEISKDTWVTAKSNPSLMRELVNNFLRQRDNYEMARGNRMTSQLIEYGIKNDALAFKPKQQSSPKQEPKINKLLLLCDQH